MNLRELLSPLANYQSAGDLDIEITGLSTDSRKVKPGHLFIALRGFQVDGHQFIHQAGANGAAAYLVEEEKGVPQTCVRVSDTKRALALLADHFYGHPTSQLKLIGVTGTNGKTTVTHLVEQILNDARHPAGIIGTIQMRMGEYTEEVKNTTPDALELQRMFSVMLEKGATHACIEVSSHALEMGRVWGCDFTTAVFTNLTQDHLDYHHTMENYRHAKSLLFSQLGNTYNGKRKKFAILNQDDPASAHYQKMTAAQVITYGIENDADFRASDIKIEAAGTSFTLQAFNEQLTIHMKMIGKFSVYNVLAAAAACFMEGVPLQSIKESVEKMSGVPGRFEPVDGGQDFAVIVDYAHTPDSLENVLATAKEFTTGKLYCLIGCGGDRDRTKRPIMARIAREYSDYAVFTSDNPRTEDPQSILDDMVRELEGEEDFACIIDRKQAIERCISLAQKGDCVVIAGKGHETYQIIQNQVLDFDDREVAAFAIRNRIK